MYIHEFTRRYYLPPEQKATLDGLLCGLREGRFKIDKVETRAEQFLTNAIICRGIGLADFELYLDNVLSHFDIAIKEGVLKC